ncbi:MAG: M48 family metallopeptidase [Actinomycetota bacterium]|jgi:hypothetical protein|nr:M48 family metallopeptidase [Actinomycetota bacterium]
MSTTTASRAAPPVDVRVSPRRKKTAGAHWEGDRIVVVVPAHLRGRARDSMVDELARRLATQRPLLHASDDELVERATVLGRRYLDGVTPASIRWSSRQRARWGSCSLHSREIRISDRLRVVPEWVLDGVIVHELAHLLVPDHSPRFRALERRYPRQGDAEVFLSGFALGLRSGEPTPGELATDGSGLPDDDRGPWVS